MYKKIITYAFTIILILSCNQQNTKINSKKKDNNTKNTIKILYPNWAEGIAFTYLAKTALTSKGYNIKLIPLEPYEIFESLAKKNADFMMDAWLPNTHNIYWAKYKNKLDKLGVAFANHGTTGLAVPTYVDIDSISQLNKVAKKFHHKIIGIETSAGINANTELAIKKYNLNFKQISSTDQAMVAALKKAYKTKSPIIITAWKPHYMWKKYKLKYLIDSKNVYPIDSCVIISRKGFKKEFPKIAYFLSNFSLNEKQLDELMKIIKSSNDTQSAINNWYNNHKKLIDSWMPKELKQK